MKCDTEKVRSSTGRRQQLTHAAGEIAKTTSEVMLQAWRDDASGFKCRFVKTHIPYVPHAAFAILPGSWPSGSCILENDLVLFVFSLPDLSKAQLIFSNPSEQLNNLFISCAEMWAPTLSQLAALIPAPCRSFPFNAAVTVFATLRLPFINWGVNAKDLER